MDFRAILLILIVAGLVFYYLGVQALVFCVLLGIFIAAVAFVYTLLRAEGKIREWKKWYLKLLKKTWKAILKWWDEL